ncbi:MAG: hypothetical protein U0822_27100 [Anaerolineae bacterium]
MKRVQFLVALAVIALLAIAISACAGGAPSGAAVQQAAPTVAAAAQKAAEAAPTVAAAVKAAAPTAAAAAQAAAPAAGATTVKIVSSLPMTGSSLGQTQTVVNAAKQAFEEANYAACDGKVKIVYEPWDDATAAAGKWTPEAETENANKAAADKSIIAYIGTFNSGAAKLSIPILNQAGPLVMVSPANTYPGLTKTAGAAQGEPDVYYPTKTRNYTRVVPADDLQGVPRTGPSSLAPRTSTSSTTRSCTVSGLADVFEASAKKPRPERPRPWWHRRQGRRLQGFRQQDQGHQPRPDLLRRHHPEQRGQLARATSAASACPRTRSSSWAPMASTSRRTSTPPARTRLRART